MKAKTKFTKFYYKLPEKAKKGLIYKYWDRPYSVEICMLEIKNNTELGKIILKELGFKDDK